MSTYGVNETNPIDYEDHQDLMDSIQGEAWLGDKNLAHISRLRLVSEPGYPMWDLSYCYGVLEDGTNVRVHLPIHQFTKRRLKWELVEMCREAKVYAKGIGILDNISTLC